MNKTAASGSPSAERFREVVLPHLADALSLARWMTGSPHDAEDVVQEACLKAFAGIGTYAGGNARAWVLTIVRHACFTWLARNRPRDLVLVGDVQDVDDQTAGNLGDDRAETPETALIARADEAAIAAAIAALPHPFREMVVLRDINGLGYREIATMLTLPLGTVMSRLSRARNLLMRELGSRR
jgi:RNA polymerase sigma factor (sigma-70 family)